MGSTIAGFMVWNGQKDHEGAVRNRSSSRLGFGFPQAWACARADSPFPRVFPDFLSFLHSDFQEGNRLTHINFYVITPKVSTKVLFFLYFSGTDIGKKEAGSTQVAQAWDGPSGRKGERAKGRT